MTIAEDISGAKRLRTVARMWYRADHAAANAGGADRLVSRRTPESTRDVDRRDR